jgi:hypothetical protein
MSGSMLNPRRRFSNVAQRWTLLLAVSLLAVLGCDRNKGVTHGIDTQVRAGATAVNLTQVADFDWDRLFVFGPYSYPEGMCKDLGFSSRECSAAALKDVDEGDFLLVFLTDGTITHRETFSRLKGNFDRGCLGKAIPRADARLAIDRREGGVVYLVCRR